MERDGVTRVYIGHPLRVLNDTTSKVSAIEVYPAKDDVFDRDEERAIGVWANADVQLMSCRYYTGEENDPIASTLVRVVYAGIIYETRGPIRVEEGLVEAVSGQNDQSEYEVIARSIESQLGRTGLTIICE